MQCGRVAKRLARTLKSDASSRKNLKIHARDVPAQVDANPGRVDVPAAKHCATSAVLRRLFGRIRDKDGGRPQ